MPCLGSRKCPAAWRQRAVVLGVKDDATVVPSGGQMDFAIRFGRAGSDRSCYPRGRVSSRNGNVEFARPLLNWKKRLFGKQHRNQF